ncbi:DUF6234 family protein [Streptomyces sp. NPDC060209]|uniref:DUF6234 family protein n=1 Tax=Streptomyces sp. NPDC060209 TaxID=3347073 RepID=UPI003656CB21
MAMPPPSDSPPWRTHHPRYTGANHPLPSRHRWWLHPAADIALAVGLLVIDVIAALGVFVHGVDAAGYRMFDAAADNSSVSLARPFAHVAVAGHVVLGSAVLLLIARARISGGVQALAGIVLVLVAMTGMHDTDGRVPPTACPGLLRRPWSTVPVRR